MGWHSTVLQLPHNTTVCEWLNTVVLQSWQNAPHHFVRTKSEDCCSLLSGKTNTQLTGAVHRENPKKVNSRLETVVKALTTSWWICISTHIIWGLIDAIDLARRAVTMWFQFPNPFQVGDLHGETSLALYIHEKWVWRLHESLELVLPLLQLRRGVQQVNIVGKHLSTHKFKHLLASKNCPLTRNENKESWTPKTQ